MVILIKEWIFFRESNLSQYFLGFREVPIIEFHTPFKTVNLESWKVLAFNLILQCQKWSIIKGR